MRIVSTNFIPDRSRPGLTKTAIGAVDLQGAGGNWATVGGRSRGGRRVRRQREKRKGKSVGLRIGTLNVGTMTGKGRELADMMERRKVDILCVQETRWKGSKARSIGAGFKLFYYGVDSKRNGVGVVLKEEFVRNVLEVKRVSDRVMSLKLEIEGVMLNVVSGYAPQVGCELEEKERFWSELDEVMESIPTGERVVIGADFNGHVGEGNRGDEEVMGKFGVKERNLEGQMVVDFAKRMDMAVVNTYFQKREEHRVTYKSGGRRTQVDYILCRRGNLKEISDCKVVVGESVARQHRMVVCRMTLMVCKTKRSKIEKKTKWWKLKKEECCEEFRQKLRQALGGQVVLPDDWETTAEVIRETRRKVLGVSSGRRKEDKETWWWNEEVQDSVQRKRLAKKKWDMDRTEENRQEYKELQRRVKREVSKAKQKAYDELYTRLDTREGEKDLYRLARQRDRDGKDVQQVRVIKDRDGRVLTSEESVQRRWKEYFEELMNEENEREKRVEGVNSVEQKVDKIRKDEVRKALKRMKSGKAVGPNDIKVEVWKCLGEAAVEFLASLFNRVLESERMPEEWRRSVLVPIFKNKGDVQSCSNYRGIKLMSHTMKLWERVVEARLRKVVEICEQQYGFMPRKSTTDAIFALRILMEKYRDGQRELHCVFVDLEKAYDRVPREELWYCMRKSGVAETYVRVVQDMYERSRTVVRCAVGQTEEFNVEVGLHQGSALSPLLFAIVMDQLSEEVRQESPWTMMFADDIVICSESREQVEENLERWRFVLERRGMKVSGSKTEYMCVNEREGSGTVRLQGEEVKKVQEFKYLGSTVQSNGECGKEQVVRMVLSGLRLSRQQLKRLEGHRYSSEGKSLLEPFMQPFWCWLVDRVPLWVAPNLITTIGLALNITTTLILAYHCPTATEQAPTWVYLSCAVGLFIYQSLDAIDGKQARRTSSSTPLGELFDHGCDSLSTGETVPTSQERCASACEFSITASPHLTLLHLTITPLYLALLHLTITPLYLALLHLTITPLYLALLHLTITPLYLALLHLTITPLYLALLHLTITLLYLALLHLTITPLYLALLHLTSPCFTSPLPCFTSPCFTLPRPASPHHYPALPRPASPYLALLPSPLPRITSPCFTLPRPASPHHYPALPRPASLHHYPALPRPASPHHYPALPRPASPYLALLHLTITPLYLALLHLTITPLYLALLHLTITPLYLALLHLTITPLYLALLHLTITPLYLALLHLTITPLYLALLHLTITPLYLALLHLTITPLYLALLHLTITPLYLALLHLTITPLYLALLHLTITPLYLALLHLTITPLYLALLHLTITPLYLALLHLTITPLYLALLHLTITPLYLALLHLTITPLYLALLHFTITPLYLAQLHLTITPLYLALLHLTSPCFTSPLPCFTSPCFTLPCPASPHHYPALPRPASPHHYPALPRPASPHHYPALPRPASPYLALLHLTITPLYLALLHLTITLLYLALLHLTSPCFTSPLPRFTSPCFTSPLPRFTSPCFTSPLPRFTSPCFTSPLPRFTSPCFTSPLPRFTLPCFTSPLLCFTSPCFTSPRPASPHHYPALPRPASPHHYPALPRPASPHHYPALPRPASPYLVLLHLTITPLYLALLHLTITPLYLALLHLTITLLYLALLHLTSPCFTSPLPRFISPCFTSPLPRFTSPCFTSPLPRFTSPLPRFTSPCFTSPLPCFTSPLPRFTSPLPRFTSPCFTSPLPRFTSPLPRFTSPLPRFTSPCFTSPLPRFTSPCFTPRFTSTRTYGIDVTEVQMFIILVYLLAALGGTALWSSMIPVLNVQVKMIPAFLTFLGGIFSCTNYFPIIFTGGMGKNGSTIAGTSVLSPAFHITLVLVLAVFVYKMSAEQLFEKNPCLFVVAFGFGSAKLTNRLVVAHMSKSEMQRSDTAFLAPLLLVINQYFNSFFSEHFLLWVALITYCVQVLLSVCVC
ncbi:hypothetical protein QTP70_025389, partial [Hemibagrus guttatus]